MAQSEAALAHRATDRLQGINARTLVLTGDADQLIPASHSDALAAQIPQATLVKIPGGSHAFNFEAPDVFNKAVLDFLSAAPA
jgi:pimeloyl-ACP methyl ester carboxylesterase